MPPKRARADKKKKEEEEDPPDAPSPATAERKARADEKMRAALATKRAIRKGEKEESKDEESTPSPVKKKSRDDDGVKGGYEGSPEDKFDPRKILAQANIGNIVDLTTPGFIPLELDSPQLDSDSFQSLSQLSPGIQIGNLSLNSSDSPNQAASILHAAGESAVKEKKDDNFAEGLQALVGTAVSFLKKTDKEIKKTAGGSGGIMKSRKKGPDSLNAPYKKGKSIMGINMFTNVLSKTEDLLLLERTYSAAELVLLSSPVYPLDGVHKKAIAAVHKTRLANERAGVQEAMTINQCLAWLARAANCEVSHLIPSGEYYPDAVDYLRIRLTPEKLPLSKTTCTGHNTQKWIAHQVTRCLQIMAVADLRPLVTDDRCILLFAIGVLYIDDGASVAMREAAEKTINNVLSSCSDLSPLLEPLFNLTPLIVRRPDEASKWILMFKNSGVDPAELLIAIGSSIFVFVSERGECAPDLFHYPTPSATFTSYVNVLTETVMDVFDVYNIMTHRRFHHSLVTILNLVLTPTALRECEENSKRAMVKCIETVIYRLKADLPEDAIVITELRTLMRRVERVQDGKKGRRTSQEVAAILADRRLRKQEKAEQLKGGKTKKVVEKEEEKKRVDVSDEEEEGSEEMRERSRREEQEEEEDEDEDEEDEAVKERDDDLEAILDLLSDGEPSEGMMEEEGEKEEKRKKGEKGPTSIFSACDFMELDEDGEANESIEQLDDTVPETIDDSN